MQLRVAYTASSAGDGRDSVCVVIDVVRATTTMLALCEAGAGPIHVVATDLDAARQRAATANPPMLLVGEQGGLIAPGFDFDNSPTAVRAGAVAGRAVVMRTTNGTVALSRVAAAPLVLVACIRNGEAAIADAVREAAARNLDILIVCSGQGHGTSFALDDALAAGYLVACAWEHHGPWEFPDRVDATRTIHESAMAALALYRSFVGETTMPEPETVTRALLQGEGPRFVATTGRLDDVRFCALPRSSTLVPRVTNTADGPVVAVPPRAAAPPGAPHLPHS